MKRKTTSDKDTWKLLQTNPHIKNYKKHKRRSTFKSYKLEWTKCFIMNIYRYRQKLQNKYCKQFRKLPYECLRDVIIYMTIDWYWYLRCAVIYSYYVLTGTHVLIFSQKLLSSCYILSVGHRFTYIIIVQ